MFDPLVPLVANDAPTKKIVKAFLTRLREGQQVAFNLNPPMNALTDDGRGGVLPPLDIHRGGLPMIELGSSDLGDDLRKHLGIQRLGLAPGKYRRAEVFGFRAIDSSLGPILIIAVAEKGDRGSGWSVTADPLATDPLPAWANSSSIMTPPAALGGYGGEAFQPWHQLSVQVMAQLGHPVDPRYLFPPDHPVVRTWWAVRDRLVLQQVTGATAVENGESPKKSARRRV
jgi:hypothetical protein